MRITGGVRERSNKPLAFGWFLFNEHEENRKPGARSDEK